MGLADGVAWEKDYVRSMLPQTSDYCGSCMKQDVCKHIVTFNAALNNINQIIDTPETGWFMTGDIRCKFYIKNTASR